MFCTLFERFMGHIKQVIVDGDVVETANTWFRKHYLHIVLGKPEEQTCHI